MAHFTPLLKRKSIKAFIGSLVLATVISSHAYAQLPNNASEAAIGEAGAGRVQERLLEQRDLTGVSSKVEVRDLVLQDVPEGAENIRFQLNSLEIEGVSVYTGADLQSSYNEYLGTTVSLRDIYSISTRLTNKYRNDGYILTQVIVPPQTIEGGRVKLRVVEGFVSNITIVGTDNPNELKAIRGYMSNIKTGEVLNSSDLERYLLLVNDLPGVDARSVLSPAENEVGGANLQIIVERKKYDAYLGIDNYGSRYLGPVQISAFGSVNSAFGYNERITGQIVATPDHGLKRELLFLSLGYDVPINNAGTRFELLGSVTDTEPGYTLKQFEVKGRSQYIAATIRHPFIRSRSENMNLYGTLDWRDIQSKNNLETTREDRIRAARLGVDYQVLDTIWRPAVNSINVELSQGLNIFNASKEGDANLTRPQGDPQFTKITADIQRLQSITNSVNLLFGVSGQLANKALLSSEEFGVGGINIGRGFDGSEIIGDDGVSGKIEAQWKNPYHVDYVENYQLYTFFDAGTIWNNDATSSSTKTDTVTSAGLGIRADFPAQTKAHFGVAWPLNRKIETQDDKDARFYFSLGKTF